MSPTADDLRRMSAERVAELRQRYPILFYNARPSARPFYYDEHIVQFLFGPNRGGKSEATVSRGSMALTGIEPIFMPGSLKTLPKPPVVIRHCVTTMERVGRKIILPKYLRWIPPEMLDDRVGKEVRGFNKQSSTLYLKNGSYVEFVSYDVDPSQWASAAFHIVIFDEPPPEGVYLAQYKRIEDYGGQMWGAMTLNARECTYNIRWVDHRIRRYGDGQHIAWWKLKPGENKEFLKREHPERSERIEAVYQAAIAAMTPEERLAAIEGEPSWLAGLVWPEFDPQVHCRYDKLKPTDFASLVRQGYGEIHCAFDHGVDHPTVCLWFFVAKRPCLEYDIIEGDHIGIWEYWRRHVYPQDHAPAIAKINQHLGVTPRVIWADPSASVWGKDAKGGPSVATFYMSRPWCLPFSQQTNNDHDCGYAAVAAMLRPRTEGRAAWPRLRFCKGRFPRTTEEVLGLIYDPKWAEGKNRDKVMEVKDDCPDCLRYMATRLLWLRPGEKFQARPSPVSLDPILGVPQMRFPVGIGA